MAIGLFQVPGLLGDIDPTEYLPTALAWWEVLLALLSVLAGWFLSRYAKRGTLALLRRTPGFPDALRYLIARMVQYLLILLGVGIALAFLGVNIQPVLAIVVIIVAVLVLTVRGFAENFTAGMLIQSRQSVRIGDEIQVDGPDGQITGTITELNGRAVIMETTDGRTVHTPNATLLGEVLVNHSRQGLRRSEVQVRTDLPSEVSLESLSALLRQATSQASGVDPSKPIKVLALSFSPERYTFRLEFWHSPSSGPAVTSEVIVGVSAALKHSGMAATVSINPGPPPLIPPDTI